MTPPATLAQPQAFSAIDSTHSQPLHTNEPTLCPTCKGDGAYRDCFDCLDGKALGRFVDDEI